MSGHDGPSIRSCAVTGRPRRRAARDGLLARNAAATVRPPPTPRPTESERQARRCSADVVRQLGPRLIPPPKNKTRSDAGNPTSHTGISPITAAQESSTSSTTIPA